MFCAELASGVSLIETLVCNADALMQICVQLGFTRGSTMRLLRRSMCARVYSRFRISKHTRVYSSSSINFLYIECVTVTQPLFASRCLDARPLIRFPAKYFTPCLRPRLKVHRGDPFPAEADRARSAERSDALPNRASDGTSNSLHLKWIGKGRRDREFLVEGKKAYRARRARTARSFSRNVTGISKSATTRTIGTYPRSP